MFRCARRVEKLVRKVGLHLNERRPFDEAEKAADV